MVAKKCMLLVGPIMGASVVILGYLALAPPVRAEGGTNPTAVLHTSAGDITLVLRADAAPKTVARFIDHATRGVYDGVIFDRVSASSPQMVLGGAILANGLLKTGVGPHEYPDRETDGPLDNSAGRVGIVDYGDVVDSHEFYVCVTDYHEWDGQKSVFAEVGEGMPLLEAIASSDDGQGHPQFVVTIETVDIIYGAP